MTLTYPILNRARGILWLVTGKDKVAALARLREGDVTIPAGRIQRDNALVLADQAAAGATRPKGGAKYANVRARRHDMRIGIATDHGGFALKEELVKQLRGAGHEVVEFGAYRLDESDDYPDYVVPLAQAVAAQEVERGLAICGSGVG